MKFKIDVSKQTKKGKGISSKKELGYSLAGVILALSVIIYPIKKYKGTYLPLQEEIASQKDKLIVLEKRIQGIKQNTIEVNNKRKLLSQLKNEGVSWTGKLVSLSRLMPKHMWLTSLYEEEAKPPPKKEAAQTKKEKTLIIKGEILLVPEKGYLERIARFTTDLNSASTFNEDIEPINLIYTKPSQKKENAETMVFELRGKFKF